MNSICRIICTFKDEIEPLAKLFSGYPVIFSEDLDLFLDNSIPTMLIGWENIKKIVPNQNISNFLVDDTDNEWYYSESERKQLKRSNFNIHIEKFIDKHLKKWLPSEFIIFDPLVHNDDIVSFAKSLDQNVTTFIHFNNGALYLRNGESNYIINLKSFELMDSNYTYYVSKLLNEVNCMIFTYKGIENVANLSTLGNVKALDNIMWVKYGHETDINYFQIVPDIDIHKYVPFFMSLMPEIEITEDEFSFLNRMSVRDNATRRMSSKYIALHPNYNKNLKYKFRKGRKLVKVNFSNKRTITGRIACRDDYNPQNLEKNGLDRSAIISRYDGGEILQIDYVSFEARIALYTCGNSEYIKENRDKDTHYETSKIIFNTHNISEDQRNFSKIINMQILYGAREATIINKMQSIDGYHEKLSKIRQFLAPMIKKSREIISLNSENGYIINPWGSIIRPEKDYAAFNNYLQSSATEIIIDKTIQVDDFLMNYKSTFMFQVHDSMIFDIHPEEFFLVNELRNMISVYKNMNFSIESKIGYNYRDLVVI